MTKLYLHKTDLYTTYSTASKSTALPPYTTSGLGRWSLSTSIGSAQGAETLATTANTVAQKQYFSKFISAPLTVTSVDANTWIIAIGCLETSTNANSFAAFSIYVLKSDDTVRGYIYDSATALGATEWPVVEAGKVYTVSGAAVAGVVSTDRLVIEIWRVGTQSMATAYNQQIFYDGATEPTNDVATTDAAGYIDTPQDIFASPGATATPSVVSATASVATPVVMPFERANSAEGGTNGVAVTAANSGGTSGDAFSADATASATCSFTADNTHPAHGSLGYKVVLGGTAGESYVYWTDPYPKAAYWHRAYLYWTANPGAVTSIFRALSGTTVRASVVVNATGNIVLRDAAGTGQATSTNTIPLNATWRIEAYIKGDAAAGQIEAKIFSSPDSTTPLETVTTAANINTGGTIDRTRIGHAGTGVANVTYWLDDIGVSSGGYMGPAPVSATAAPAVVAGTTSIAAPTVWTGPTVRPEMGQYLATASVTSAVVPLPSTWQAGDIVYIGAALRSSTGSFTGITAGWSAVAGPVTSVTDASCHGAVYRRVMQAGDTAPTVTCASGRVAASSIAVVSGNNSTPEDVAVAVDANQANGTSIVAPSVTPVNPNSLLLAFNISTSVTSGAIWTVSPAGGMTELADICTQTGTQTNSAVEIADLNLPGTSATGTKTATASATINPIAATIVVRSSAAGGDATATPGVVSATASIAAPTIVAGATVAPAVVAGTTAIAAPTITVSVNTAPAVVAGTTAIATPGVTTAGAPVFVQQATGSSAAASTTISATFGAAPTSGNLLVFVMGGDKNTGALTLAGWTIETQLLSTSVSLYMAWKVSNGTETTVSASWANSSASGNVLWVGEYQQTGSDPWSLLAKATNITDETVVNTKATGTTASVAAGAIALAMAAVDTSTSVTTVNAWGNGYTIRFSGTGFSARGAPFVAEHVTLGGTESSTFNYTGTADQVSAAIGVLARAVGGATATPAVVSGSTSIATPTITVDATATPAVVAGITSIAVPTVQTGATLAPAVVSGSTAIAVPTVTVVATVTLSTVVGSTTIVTPGRLYKFAATTGTIDGLTAATTYSVTVRAVDTSENRSAESSPIVVTTTAPGVTATPGVVSGTATVATPTVTVDVAAGPAVVSSSTTIAAPTAQAGAMATPAVVSGSTAIAVPVVTAGGSATAVPTVVSATAAIAGPTITASSRVSPVVVASTTAIAVPVFTSSVSTAPTVVGATATVPGPQVATTALATPAVVSGTSTIPAPTVTAGGGATALPATVAGTTSVAVPVLQAGSMVSPAVVSGLTSIAAPVIAAGARAAPLVVSGSTTVSAVSVTVAAVITPVTVAGTSAIATPALITSSRAAPSTVGGTTTVPVPTFGGGVQVVPAVVQGTSTIPGATITVSVRATPTTVGVVSTVATPVVVTGSRISATVIQTTVTIPTPFIFLVVQDIDVVYGQPQLKWRVDDPELRWAHGAPETKWRVGNART